MVQIITIIIILEKFIFSIFYRFLQIKNTIKKDKVMGI